MKHLGLTAAFCFVLAVLPHSLSFPEAAVRAADPNPASANGIHPNELGKVLILEYHTIQPEPGRWARSTGDFRRDLELLYNSGYRTLAMKDYLGGRIDLPTGTHPVLFTFDDSSPGQFRYLVKNGKREIDPDCAVGILIDFGKRHPDFGMKATFFVLPGAQEPHRLFGQPEFEADKLRELASLGFEIGNHTLWHANLKKYDAAVVRRQLSLAVKAIDAAVPGYKVNTLALPFGMYPKDIAWAVDGSYQGVPYHNDAILEVSGGPAPSPFCSQWDPLHLPRIQVIGKELGKWIRYFEKHPDEIYVSDGKTDIVSFPAVLKPEFNPWRFKSLRTFAY
jgi:peptidoglycan/xylan/chitin deacetylase (PgdA/CDA1 family)